MVAWGGVFERTIVSEATCVRDLLVFHLGIAIRLSKSSTGSNLEHVSCACHPHPVICPLTRLLVISTVL